MSPANRLQSTLLKSSTTIDAHVDGIPGSRVPKIASAFFGQWVSEAWLSTLVIGLMTVALSALFVFPLKRTFANVEVSYNEGWNAYRAEMVSHGIPIYGARPQGFGTATAYPPLSFHLVALLGSMSTFTLVGRCLSLIALIATGVFIGLIVKEAGASSHTAVFSFLLYELGIVLLRPDRVGMYDPQLLAEALSTAGLYLYARNPESMRLLCSSALLFCLAGFTKHNLVAFPAAVGIDLLFRSRKALATWTGAMLISGGLLTSATFLIDGRYFLLHLMGGGGGRGYSYWMAWSQFHHYVEKFQSLLVIGTAWSILALRSRRVLALAFILSHGLAFMLAGGYGIDLNLFFNAFAATVIACGLALSDVSSSILRLRSGALNSTAAIMFGLFCISIMIFVPGQLRRDRQQIRNLPTYEAEFNSSVEFLRSHSGPALCESHLLCYEAGKPFEFEPFSVRDQVMTGRIHESDVLALLKTHHFQTVEVAVRSDEEDLSDSDLQTSLSSDQKDPDKERRFSPSFMKELLQDYQLSKRTSLMAIFCPQ